MAYNGLFEVGSEKAVDAYVRGLDDPDGAVRETSVRGLLRQPGDTTTEELLASLRENPHDGTRVQVPLIVGLTGDGTAVEPLEAILEEEQDQVVAVNIELALARLGDAEQREELIRRLRDPRVGVRLKAVRDVAYVGDGTVAGSLAPLLDDRQEAFRTGVSTNLRQGRICDAAVISLSQVFGAPFSFDVGRITAIFNDEEIEEVRRFMRSQPLPGSEGEGGNLNRGG